MSGYNKELQELYVTWSVETARQYNVMISYLITHVDTIIQSDIEARLLNRHGNAV